MPIIHPDDPIRLLVDTPTASIAPTATLHQLAVMLDRECVGALMVMPDERPAGLVSERDLARAVATDRCLDEVWVGEVMTDELTTIDVDATIAEAADAMLTDGVRHLPVVDGGGLVGVVSIRDVLQVFVSDWRRSGG